MNTGKRILKNLFSLTFAELAGKGLVALTYIYLARVIQPEGLGIIGVILSYVSYFIALTQLGFDSIGTREVARNRDNISSLVNSIFTIKFILGLIAVLVYLIFVAFINVSSDLRIIWLIASSNIIANSISINWFYYGIEKMGIIALRQIVTGLMNLFGIILLVQGKGDTMIAMLVLSLSLLLNVLWILVYYTKKYSPLKLSFDLKNWLLLFKQALPLGIAFVMVVVYNNISITMIGYFGSNADAGYFNAAMKIISLVIIPSGIIQSSFFPLLSNAGIGDRINYMHKFTLLMYFVGILISSIILTYSENIIYWVFGDDYSASASLLKLLMITLLLQYLSVSFSTMLVAWGKENKVIYGTSAGTIIILALNFVLIPLIGVNGAALSTIFSELSVALILSIFLIKALDWIYFKNLVVLIIISIIGNLIGYFIMTVFSNAYLGIITSISLIFLFSTLTKLISIKELRGYLKN